MLLRLRRSVPALHLLGSWGAPATPCAPAGSLGGWAAAARATLGGTPGSRSVGAAAAAAAEGDSEPSPPAAAPKRRTRRKAAAEPDAAAAADGSEGGDAQQRPSAGAEDGAPAAPAARRAPRRTKKAAEEERAAAAASASGGGGGGGGDDSTQAEGGASSSSGIAGAPVAPKKRASRSKKAAAVEGEQEEEAERTYGIGDLPFEDFWVLPRKAEYVLNALGLFPPTQGTWEVLSGSAPAAAPARIEASDDRLLNPMELSDHLGWRDPRALTRPLLAAQYQRYLGDSADLLYDMYCMDQAEGSLPSESVRDAVVAAAKAMTRGVTLTAPGAPPEPLVQQAMSLLRQAEGNAAVDRQEQLRPGLTRLQVELFAVDFLSASKAGASGGGGSIVDAVSRRCAALELTRPVVVQRLVQYAVHGVDLAGLAATTGRGGPGGGRLSQPLDALTEGVKAGVRLDRERLMRDFRMGSPADPLYEHLDTIKRWVATEALSSAEPGSGSYYDLLTTRLRMSSLSLMAAFDEQERRWKDEQKLADGRALTTAQLRLLFNLWRLDRFRHEHPRRIALLDAAARQEQEEQQQQQEQQEH